MSNTMVAAVAPVEFTPLAAGEVRKALEGIGEAGSALRILVVGMSCSGPRYGMQPSEPEEGDTQFTQHGVRFVIDADSLEQMRGSTVDFVNTPDGGGFKIDNPNVEPGCGGCGGGCGHRDE